MQRLFSICIVLLLVSLSAISAAPVPPATSPTPFPTITPSRLPEPSATPPDSLFLDANFRAPRLVAPDLPARVLALSSGKFLVFFYQSTLVNHAAGCVTRYNADGSYDPTFQVTALAAIDAARELPNHQLIVAGAPNANSAYYSPLADQVLRLNEDGSVDNSFSATAVTDNYVQYIAIAPDGKIVLNGHFTKIAGTSFNGVARLSVSGEPDPSFTSPSFGGATVTFGAAPVVQPDGRILIAGSMLNPNNGRTAGYVARLNTDGSVDTSFNASGFTVHHTLIRGLALLPSGQVVIAGSFVTPASNQGNSLSYFPLLRLNQDGSLDSSFGAFDPDEFGTDYNFFRARDVTLLPNGQFLALIFRAETNVDDNSILRFNADGTLDTSFHPPFLRDFFMGSSEFEVAIPYSLAVVSDGTILMAGSLNANRDDTLIRWGVARLNADGTATNFAPELGGFYDYPSGAVRFGDGKTWITATPAYIPLDFYNTIPNNFAQLDQSGSFDFSFNLAASFGDLADPVTGVAPLSTGEALAWRYDENTGITYFERVEENGTVDIAYQPVSLNYDTVSAQPDGSVILSAGTFAQAMVDGSVFRIGTDGKLDSNFHLDTAISDSQHFYGCGNYDDLYLGIYALGLAANNKLIVSYFAADGLWHIARLNPEGSLDSSFQPATTPGRNVTLGGAHVNCSGGIADGGTSHIPGNILNVGAVLPDNSVVVAGPFNSFNGNSANGVVHLLANGLIDQTFNVGLGPQWASNLATSIPLPAVDSIYPLPNGNLLVVGEFDTFSGVAAPGIVMLHRDGSVDTSFTSPVERIYARTGMAQLIPQNDGSVLLSGPYSFTGQNFERSLVRLTFDALPFITSAVSRKTHGSAGTYDINLPLSGTPTVECRSGGPTGNYQIVLTFTNNVVSGNAAVSSGKGNVSATQFSGNTMVINLTGVSNAQTLGLTLQNVTNTYAQTLPDTTLHITFLNGDVNGDGAVNAADATQVRNNSGQQVTSANFRADLNGDGVVNSADATIVRNSSGTGISGQSRSAKMVSSAAKD